MAVVLKYINTGKLLWDPDRYINPISYKSLPCQSHLKDSLVSFCLPFLALLLGSFHCNLCRAQISSRDVQGSFLLLIDEDKLQWRLAMLFTETCNRRRESSSWGKNWADPLGHTNEPGESTANKSCSSPFRYSITHFSIFIVLDCPDHVPLTIKTLSYVHITGKVRSQYFQPGICELKEKSPERQR